MAGMMGQFILLTRRQIKPGGAPKRSFVSYQPNVRFAPIADIRAVYRSLVTNVQYPPIQHARQMRAHDRKVQSPLP